ncbi:MAG: M48 family metallopeptidase [Gammaproteobacteria bacterium]|nr:M48 family metallopeptidase [Gammaproteobacteria bacterium]MBU1969152.1 M48 family metallopeptidase [Gammaproteobacteria bacterium]
MNTTQFAAIFVAALLANTVIKLWLAWRQLDHVAAHRAEVPAAFRDSISLEAHHKAADYTHTQVSFGILNILFDVALLLGFTLGGGIQWLSDWTTGMFDNALVQGVAVIVAVLMLQSLLEIPFDLYRIFKIEARYGFNKMTLRLYLIDGIKGLLLGAAFGLPLLFGVLWLMGRMGDLWWLYVWGVWVTFNLLMLFIYPAYIAPLFNKFEPMQDETQRSRIEALLAKCGFSSGGLFVMDGSKRSTHGNAYFTGFGKTKRIVFFDTLLQRLTPDEIDAVLAHELGHFRKHHVLQRIAVTFAVSLGFLWGLAQLLHAEWFYQGLGVTTQTTALALLLFVMALPVFTFLLHPLASAWSRKHEFEADDYAATYTDAKNLVSALVKLYQDNAKTLTPDPVYATFYESHPPAPIRIAHLQQKGETK